MFWKITCIKPCKYQQILTFASSFATSQQMLKHWYLQRFWTMIVAKKCYFWSVFPQISCGRYPPNLSKFPKPHFLLTCTYFRGRRHGRNLPMAKATDGLAFGTTRHCRIEGLPPMPPTPANWRRRSKSHPCVSQSSYLFGKKMMQCNHKQKMRQPPRSRPEEREDSSLKRKPIPRQRALWGMHPKQGNPSRIQAQTCQNHPP